MYRSHGASCPSCHNALTPLPTTLSMWGCFACGGVWLGPEAAVHVMRGLGDEVEQNLAAASVETARRSFVPAPDSGSRECPTCGLVMSHLPVGDIVIDSCPTHGSFFDRDEVQAVVDACRRLRRRQEPGLGNLAREFVEDLSSGASKVVGATFAALAEEFDAFPKLPKDK
ncbi:MAG: Transcription factor zinc-finger [Myxococcales bacterium]|jgi:Zn-finger nucleic acid-binding protein|nr:Transcription factor zinc-finger [Myxococcales bacterium]